MVPCCPGQSLLAQVGFEPDREGVRLWEAIEQDRFRRRPASSSPLKGELTAVEAARRHGVSEQSVHNWKAVFVESGRAGLEAQGKPRRSSREAELEAEIDELTRALGEAHVQLRAFKRGGRAFGPSRPSS